MPNKAAPTRTKYATQQEAEEDGWRFTPRYPDGLLAGDLQGAHIYLVVDQGSSRPGLSVYPASGQPSHFPLQGYQISLTDEKNKLGRKGAVSTAVHQADIDAAMPRALAKIGQ